MYLEAYYTAYLGLCAVLILLLSLTFHNAGSVFLHDAFGGNATLVRAVAHLLDVGFYLVSLGYVGVSYRILWGPINSYGMVAEAVIGKLGGFLLLLGFAHLFNLLLLALFRKRGAAASGTGVA
jgi:hypothetical protein